MSAKRSSAPAKKAPSPKATSKRAASIEATARVTASCHCGAVTLHLKSAPGEVVSCDCSLCRRWGVLWVYLPASDLVVEAGETDTYAWNGRHVDFHRCKVCGCLTHWVPRDAKRQRRGVNARLLDPDVLAAAPVRHRDGRGS